MTRVLLFLSISLIVAAVSALGLVEAAHDRAWFDDPVNYHHHVPPETLVLEGHVFDVDPAEDHEDGKVPRLFLASLPPFLDHVDRGQELKDAFITTLLPLGLRVNEIIIQDRNRFLRLREKLDRGDTLKGREVSWLLRTGRRYGLKEPLDNLVELDKRLRPIPVSLMLAQAAIESGWGTSRFARQGNALFGQWTWSESDKGIVPKARKQGAKHRIKAFDYLIQSVLGYAYNLNRNQAYSNFRDVRARQQDSDTINSLDLAATLTSYSERREAYVRDLQNIIRSNDLRRLDSLSLAQPGIPSQIAAR